ncbi:MAG: substrate-binding domain-containing protein [Streptosporangiaceae bacterium]|nr:substrate-binding domain-containing protein [Streptosporangiaceae bacterium]
MASGIASASPVVNDPPKGVTPKATDVVGVGSDTIEFLLDQLSVDYNKSHATPHLYSWDATNPTTGAVGDKIVTKAGCAKIARPDGSSAGIAALDNNTLDGKTGHFCIDFARSSRGRAATDPKFGPGGISFVALAKDAVTYATRDKAHGGTDAPANLSTAQLTNIYLCKVTNWKQVGGKNAAIKPFLPQTGSGTRAFFLKAINVTTPGTCVNSSVQENEGTNPALNSGNVIVPFSTAKFIAEVFHSAKCGKKPTGTQNMFGCDTHGVLGLNNINGTKPTVGTGVNTTPNPAFTPAFVRFVYDVVRWSNTGSHIPPYEQGFFGRGGYFCSNPTAEKDIRSYGFLITPLCGVAS